MTRRSIYQRARILRLRRNQLARGAIGAIVAGTASEAEIGWLAGFIDGEGTLQLSQARRDKTQKTYLMPRIRVVNNDLPASEKCQRLMGGRLYQHRPGSWGVTVSGMAQIAPLLATLLPHLTVKRARAELLIEYANIRQRATDMRAPYGAEEEAIYRAFYEGSGRVSASRTPRYVQGYANAVLSGDADTVA
jgi:hypothetical protein